jgi:hypothetical protein
MNLADLFSSGSHLSDVPPEFRGMPLRQWQELKTAEQCSRYIAMLNPENAPLSKQRVWTPRDGYGMKGF